MRALILAAFIAAPLSASAAVYAITDGSGATVNCVVWDGTTAWTPPPGTTATPSTACAITQAPQPPITTIDSLAFIMRFTLTEQQGLTAVNPLWGILIAAAKTIDVTSQQLRDNIAAAVAAGALSQARADQILDLSRASP